MGKKKKKRKKRPLKKWCDLGEFIKADEWKNGHFILFTAGDGELEPTPKGLVSAVVCLMALDFIHEERCKLVALFFWEMFWWYLRWGVKQPLYSGEDESWIVSVSV